MKSILIAWLVVLLSISGIGTADYSLTIQTDPPFISTVNPFIGTESVSGSVDLEAESFVSCPYVYRFDHWQGQGILDPDAAHTSVTVESSQVITAVFVDDRKCGDACHPNDGLGDLNHDCMIDLGDIAVLASRWLSSTRPEFDVLPMLIPAPSAWMIEPRAISGTLDAVEMQAVTTHHVTSPDAEIEYYFDCLTDDSYDSGWISNSYYMVHMSPGAYWFTVRVRDGEGHLTDDANSLQVIPGSAFQIPTAQWKTPPYTFLDGTTPTVTMEVQPYQNYPEALTLPGGYVAKYQFERNGNLFPYQDGTVFTDTEIIEGTTYTFRVRIAILTNGQFVIGGAFSEPVQVIFVEDKTPPVPMENQDPLHPYKAQHAQAPTTYQSQNGLYYNIVEAVQALDLESVDQTAVEYKFVCSDSRYSSGWRNRDNVAGVTYPDGTAQVPYRYMVMTGVINKPYLVWYIFYRDRSPNQNVGDSSDGWSAAGPNPVEVVNP